MVEEYLISAAVLGLIALGAVLAWRVWPGPLARVMIRFERTRCGRKSERCPIADIDWHVLTGGHGEPLILLHGFNADADHFNRAARHLTSHFRVIAPDLPGFGETRVGAMPDYRIEYMAAKVLALLDAMRIERFYVGGNSMGGYLAVAVAHQAPARVRGLWLLAPGGLHSAPYSPLYEAVYAGHHNPLVVRDLRDFERLLDYCFVRPPYLPTPLKRYLARRAANSVSRAERVFADLRFRSTPLEALASGLTVPALIVWGQADQVLHPQGLNVLADRMSHAQTLLLPATGHLPMLEKPRETAEAWLSFAESSARQQVSLQDASV
ncbi:MAG: alpha/beta fold hydrolase [Pseudomonadota bacterium]|nr:MAG: alpha/beta fold hydrolase [Pseudomonadota bacterium]